MRAALGKISPPENLDANKLKELMGVRGDGSFSDRIERISRHLIPSPYLVNPLIGSSTSAEVLSVPLQAFDCVTYVETVLAGASAKDEQGFLSRLIALRYHQGKIDWLSRNHYSVDWIDRNAAAGLVKNITPREGASQVTRTLSLLEGYPAVSHVITFLAVERLEKFKAQVQTGDLIYFGTSRENLDVSHVGFLVVEPSGRLILRHSSKSKGGVNDEPLNDFFARFGATPGVILVRPLERS